MTRKVSERLIYTRLAQSTKCRSELADDKAAGAAIWQNKELTINGSKRGPVTLPVFEAMPCFW
jgi:hypothetical protein